MVLNKPDGRIYGYAEYDMPLCYPFACIRVESVRNNTDSYSDTALWNCMPLDCKQRLKSAVVFIIILSVSTSLFNFIVIVANLMPSTRRILRRHPTMQNYSNYVLSLSVADFLVGSLVLPLAIAFFYSEMFAQRTAIPLNVTQNFDNFSLNILSRLSTTVMPFNNMKRERHNNLQAEQVNDVSLNTSEVAFPAGLRTDQPEVLMNVLCFLTHLSLFVSMYTLGASSVDRFYISTKATPTRTIRITQSSFGNVDSSTSLAKLPRVIREWSRSAMMVLLIWLLGIIFATLSVAHVSRTFYKQVGHIFIALSSSDHIPLNTTWYVVILAIPLASTWIFSSLLCMVIWRRKRRLRNVGRNSSRLDFSDRVPRSTADRDHESSFVHTSRYSNADVPITGCVTSNSSDGPAQRESSKEPDNTLGVFAESSDLKDEESVGANVLARKRHLDRCKTLPARKRPSSYDSFLVSSGFDEGLTSGLQDSQKGSLGPTQFKCHSFEEGLSASYVAKRILFRRSWDGYSGEIEFPEQPISCQSPLLTKRPEKVRYSPTLIRSPPTTPSPSSVRKSEVGRYPRGNNRARRRSSVFRAREFFLRSKSFESNIVRTLCAVVIALSVTTLPFIIVLTRLSTNSRKTVSEFNGEVTATVIALIVLLSNSLWNCLIYGARMPYFRTAFSHSLRKLFRFKSRFSCTKGVTRKISVTTNSFRNSSENRTTARVKINPVSRV